MQMGGQVLKSNFRTGVCNIEKKDISIQNLPLGLAIAAIHGQPVNMFVKKTTTANEHAKAKQFAFLLHFLLFPVPSLHL